MAREVAVIVIVAVAGVGKGVEVLVGVGQMLTGVRVAPTGSAGNARRSSRRRDVYKRQAVARAAPPA